MSAVLRLDARELAILIDALERVWDHEQPPVPAGQEHAWRTSMALLARLGQALAETKGGRE